MSPVADQVIQCSQACTVTVQLELTHPLFNIDAAGGAQIGLAIVFVWVVGFGVRQAIKAVKVGDSNSEE